MKKIMGIVLVAFLLFVGITVERETVHNEKHVTSVDYITYGTIENPDNLKLTEHGNMESGELLLSLFSGLVKEDENGEIVPVLCDKYEVSEDGLQYTFHIKEDIYYSNGDKITAEDYKRFLEEFISDEGNIYRKDLYCIYGAKAFAEGETDFKGVAVTCGEGNTLIIRLNYRCPRLINVLASPFFTLRDYNALGDYKNNYKTIRFTGPFIIDDVMEGNLYISKNPKYEGSSLISDETIKIQFFDSVEKALAYYESSGDEGFSRVDILKNPPLNEIGRLEGQGSIKCYDKNEGYYLIFNTSKGSVDSRKSLALCLNRNEYGGRTESTMVTGMNDFGFGFGTQPVFSFNEAAGEDQEEKKNLGDDTISILYTRGTLDRYLAKAVGEDIKKAFDVEINIIECTEENMNEEIAKGDYHMIIREYCPRYGYEGEFLETFISGSGDNISGYSNDEFNSCMVNAKGVSEEERRQLYTKCENLLCDDVVAVPVCSVKTPVCLSRRVDGIKCDSRGNIIFNYLRRK